MKAARKLRCRSYRIEIAVVTGCNSAENAENDALYTPDDVGIEILVELVGIQVSKIPDTGVGVVVVGVESISNAGFEIGLKFNRVRVAMIPE